MADSTPASNVELEHALAAFERALAEHAQAHERHATVEDEDEHLRDLRSAVLRRATEASPTTWPRSRCSRCHGTRMITTLQARYGPDATPSFVLAPRMCPQCRGTGMSLSLADDQRDSR